MTPLQDIRKDFKESTAPFDMSPTEEENWTLHAIRYCKCSHFAVITTFLSPWSPLKAGLFFFTS